MLSICVDSVRRVCMSHRLNHRYSWIVLAITLAILNTPTAQSQDQPSRNPVSAAAIDTPPLRFTFEAAPWRDVIKWLANESGLALHVGDLPTGSFTYSDPNPFTPQAAIDRVNLFLLPLGFTVVRSGKLLSVLNLGDPRSIQQLDVLAKLVTVEELDQLSSHEVVKCIFPLGELKAEDAVEELSVLNLMTTPAAFKKTNRLMVTDTAGKLKNIKAILDAFQPSALDNGTVMQNFPLKHVDAEEILAVARPHLGLATGEMIGIDVSLSADLHGKNIFVTGVADKVKLIEGLITSLDVPEKRLSSNDGDTVLRSHRVAGGNVETVYNVLITLLAGKPVRLSMDDSTSSVVALATPDIQAEIAETVNQLQASDAVFEVIQLKTIDPYFAITLLEEMLEAPDPQESSTVSFPFVQGRGFDNRRFDDRRRGNRRFGGGFEMPTKFDGPKVQPPKFDADPATGRLFVRGSKHQIEQIKKIIAELDTAPHVGGNEFIRVLPLNGKHAEQVLETAAKFWREPNPIILFPSTVTGEPEETERVVAGESTVARRGEVKASNAKTSDAETPSPRFLTDNLTSQEPPIRCQVTSRGLLLHCEDTSALNRFEEHLQTIAGPTDSTPSPPIVFYLKYTKPDDAIRMLAELLDGGEAAIENQAGTLVNGYVSSGVGTFLGSLVTSRQGTTTMTAGSITVVADSRLNRLIAQGAASDMRRIEGYLKIIDKDNSITSVETYGASHVIELMHAKASEVASVIRDAYAGRVTGATGGTGGGQPQPGSPKPGQRESAEAKAAPESKRAGADEKEGAKKTAPQKRSSGQSVRNLEPKMTVAVHEPSNSLIVTAPDQLFQEVEKLAKLVDSRSERVIEVFTLNNAAGIQSALQQVLTGQGAARGARAGPASISPSSSRFPLRSRSPTPAPSRFSPTSRGPAQSSFRGKIGR